MLVSRFKFGRCLGLILLAALAAGPALAQGGHDQRREKRRERRRDTVRPPANRQGEIRPGPGRGEPGGERAALGLPPRWMERLREMSPQEQERFLNNNERFRSMPPERQAEVRRRLQEWNSLTPEQRQAVREREHVWEQITPEQRRHIRETIFPKWQRLEPERRRALMQRLHVLQNLSEPERTARLNDERFLQGLSPEERAMLRDLAHLHVGGPPEPSQEPPE